jgi:hypothetical protein
MPDDWGAVPATLLTVPLRLVSGAGEQSFNVNIRQDTSISHVMYTMAMALQWDCPPLQAGDVTFCGGVAKVGRWHDQALLSMLPSPLQRPLSIQLLSVPSLPLPRVC